MPGSRVAIIGYGLAGRLFHGALIAATDGLEVAAIVTADPERQAQAAGDHPDARILDRADALWEGEPPDLVVVATPPTSHPELATAAIELRVPVVVDKPLAVSAAAASALVSRAREAGVMLSVYQNRRWDSDQLTLARLLGEGRLGDVTRFESRFERWRPDAGPVRWREAEPPERGGGVLLDLGSHLVDQAMFLFGPVSHVYAEVDARRGLPNDDDVFLALRHAGGVISHLWMSAMTAAPGPRLRVLGTRAAYTVAELDSQEAALREGRRPGGDGWGAEPEARWGRLVTGDHSEIVPSERGDWPRFYALMAAALREPGRPAPVDPAGAVAVLEVLELARRSAQSRSVLTL